MKVDILFLAKNRREYTEEALRHLERNTDWGLVNRLCIYEDITSDTNSKTSVPVVRLSHLVPWMVQTHNLSGPVAVMNEYLTTSALFQPAPWFAKIDNDTIVPPGWLDACIAIAETGNVDLIGIEARYCGHPPMPAHKPYEPDLPMHTRESVRATEPYPILRYRRTDHVGGIGLFRRVVFETHPLPRPNGTYYGFTEFQWEHPHIRKCWIDPPLPVFLLDHLPLEPWRSLGREYVKKGWQRESWGEYDPIKDRGLWEWWVSQSLPSNYRTSTKL